MTANDEIKNEAKADEAACDGTINIEGPESEDTEAKAEDKQETAEEQPQADQDSKSDDQESAADEADAAEASDKEEAEAKPDRKDKQIEELNDKYKRLFAEFDNYRKRTEQEKIGMFAEGEKTVLLKVLPLVDNFERAISSIPEDQKETALAEGIDKTYKSFMSQLKELGVTPIEAAGKPFDANLHNAVMHVEDDNVDENTVVEEFQKGYMFKEKVLRYSMVKVAN